MEKKRMFQVFDEMNVEDGDKNTKTLAVNNQIISMDKVKNGAHITFGVPYEIMANAAANPERYRLLLVAVDMDSYNAKSNQ